MLSSIAPEITECRACGSSQLEPVLDLGEHAISDFVDPGDWRNLERAPLVLLCCANCTLVQLKHTVNRDRLYRKYWYRSAVNESMVEALKDVVDDAMRYVQLEPGDVVLDIGANDGTLLQQYPDWVKKRIGVEPASNLLPEARGNGENLIIANYWPIPDALPPLNAKIITSIAQFYNVDDPRSYVAAIKKHLHPDGVWVVQMMMLEHMLKANAFDNICHEHLAYYDEYALNHLLWLHDLEVVRIKNNAVNGGSARITMRLSMPGYLFIGLYRGYRPAQIGAFAAQVLNLKKETLALLRRLKAQDKFVMGYGASTKGNTLLQYYGIGPELLPMIADRNPDKWGKVTPTGIPVVSEEVMRQARPDYLLVLPWHFIESFKQRERAFLERGGQFIVPLPDLRVEGLSHATEYTQSAVG